MQLKLGDKVKLLNEESINNGSYILPKGDILTFMSYNEASKNYAFKDKKDIEIWLCEGDFEVLKGDHPMTKINNNYYKGGLRVTYEIDYIKVFKQFGDFILFDLFIGKNNLTFKQANEMLKPFNIIILPKSTDWSNVEVGNRIKKLDKDSRLHSIHGTFHSYIEEAREIVMIINRKVYVYNEDEVELV